MTALSPSLAADSDADGLASSWATLHRNRRFHYVVTGPDAAPALLFLHGYTDSWRSAELLIPYLQGHFRIYALDQRGHGETGAGFPEYRLDNFAADAIAFIRAVINQPVTLVGHSLGSLVAQRVAADEPDLVTRLVLIGTAHKTGGNPVLVDLKAALDDLSDNVPYEFARAFQESTVAKPLNPAQLETFIRESLRLDIATWRKIAVSLTRDEDVVADRIAAPTLILWGERDGVFDLKTQTTLERLLSNVALTAYGDVGHAPNWEIPAIAARDILAFHGF